MTGSYQELFPINKKWCVFAVVATGVFLSTLDSSMVNIALPFIMETFRSPLARVEWVVMAYLVTITTTLLLWGYVGDRLGQQRIYAAGLAVFSAGAGACSLASSLSFLVAARFVQAIGAACMMACGPAIIRQTFPSEKLGKALGSIGIAVSFGLMTGPLVGGILIDVFSWRALFLLSSPIAFAASMLALLIIPPSVRHAPSYRFDWPGGLSWMLAVVLLSFAVTHMSSPQWSSLRTTATACSGLGALVLFCRVEQRNHSPLLPLPLGRQEYYWKAVGCAALSFLVLFSILMLMPFYLGKLRGLSASSIGLTMLAIPMAALLVAPLAGAASDRIGSRLLTTCGLLLSGTGAAGLGFLGSDTGFGLIAFLLALVGGGQAMFLSPNSSSLLGRVPLHFAGVSAALLATARNLGMLLGIALTGLVFSAFFRKLSGGLDLLDYVAGQEAAFLRAMRYAFLGAAGCGLLAAALAWSRGNYLLSAGRER